MPPNRERDEKESENENWNDTNSDTHSLTSHIHTEMERSQKLLSNTNLGISWGQRSPIFRTSNTIPSNIYELFSDT